MKHIRLSIRTGAVLIMLAASALAQDADTTLVGWKKSLVVDLTATQTAYSDSWTGGEAGSFSWVGNVNGHAERLLNPWLNMRSQLKLSFGQTVTQDAETKDWSKPKKSTDLIDWETVGRFLVATHVDPYVAFRVQSQFVDASVSAKKRYFSPAILTESAGAAHRFYEKDDDHITSRFGGALRQTITSNIVGVDIDPVTSDTLGFATETTTESEAGFELVTDASLSLSDKLQYTGKLGLFKAMYSSEDDESVDDDWKTIDVNFENIVTAQISKIIAVHFYTQLLYDKQIVDKVRIKETLGLGFVFKML